MVAAEGGLSCFDSYSARGAPLWVRRALVFG